MTMKAISTENATLISTTSGMPRAPVAARLMPFSSDMKPTTWLTALRRVTIISSPISTTDRASAMSSRATGSACGGDRQHDLQRQRHQGDAGEHGQADADNGFDLAMDAHAEDHAAQRDGNEDGLEDQRDDGGDVEMRRVLDMRLPGDRQRQHEGVQPQHIQQAVRRILVQHQEADQHQPPASIWAMSKESPCAAVIITLPWASHAPRDEQQQHAEQAEHQGGAEEVGHAEDAHLGDRHLGNAKRTPPSGQS